MYYIHIGFRHDCSGGVVGNVFTIGIVIIMDNVGTSLAMGGTSDLLQEMFGCSVAFIWVVAVLEFIDCCMFGSADTLCLEDDEWYANDASQQQQQQQSKQPRLDCLIERTVDGPKETTVQR